MKLKSQKLKRSPDSGDVVMNLEGDAMVTIQGVQMSEAAAECVRETSADVAADVAAIRYEIARSGVEIAESNLRAHCLDGADDDRVDGWLEYVAAVMSAAQVRA